MDAAAVAVNPVYLPSGRISAPHSTIIRCILRAVREVDGVFDGFLIDMSFLGGVRKDGADFIAHLNDVSLINDLVKLQSGAKLSPLTENFEQRLLP